ncbi:MAG: flagellin [Chthoniobacter sp.]|jgi:flagellin|nr:flagellin [Chthoniobacter sp.]
MSVIINTNTAATLAATNLGKANSMLQKSMARLSSGSKLSNSSDDAGGLGVSMRLGAAIRRSDAADTNVQNAISFLQTQDGALDSVGKVLSRIAELKTLSLDVTKSTADVANYDTEFTALQGEITKQAAGTFNAVTLFGGTTVNVSTTEDGLAAGDVAITKSDLAADAGVTAITGAANLAAVTTTNVTDAITSVAGFRAQNGADSSRLQFASDMLQVNRNNLEAANSRIADVDVAKESTALARHNIMVQAGTSMLAQANTSTQAVLKLLQ